MAVDHLLTSFILLLICNTGFSAEISVFVKTGDSVQLDIQTQKLPEFDLLSWTNDKLENIVKYIHESKKVKLHSSYKDRVDFNDETFSLTLKNMQKTDTGLYTARTRGESENNIVTYRVSVIDAVDAPVLTVNSHWSSSDSCTVNFTCRAHDLMINSNYQNNRCSPQEVTSQINTLILDCSKEAIICNYSNPVSWQKDLINIRQLCGDSLFVKTGDSVQLDIQTQKLPEFDLLSWRNDKSEIIARPTPQKAEHGQDPLGGHGGEDPLGGHGGEDPSGTHGALDGTSGEGSVLDGTSGEGSVLDGTSGEGSVLDGTSGEEGFELGGTSGEEGFELGGTSGEEGFERRGL
ncbi:unnamed protein product [Leuciscus chuanchicus]